MHKHTHTHVEFTMKKPAFVWPELLLYLSIDNDASKTSIAEHTKKRNTHIHTTDAATGDR